MTVSETPCPLRSSRGLEASGVASQVLTLGVYPSAASLCLMAAAANVEEPEAVVDAEQEKLSHHRSAWRHIDDTHAAI